VHSFELRPNSSLTPRAAVWFFLSIVAVSLPVAAGFAALGYWPVLPFAGLELAGLAWALVFSMRQGRAREYIRIDEGRVLVRKIFATFRGASAQVEYEFPKAWTRIELRRGVPAHWPSRLILRSSNRSVEVGAFLTDGERSSLKARLAEVLGTGYHPVARL
jgi:uncharacterized membrane protein